MKSILLSTCGPCVAGIKNMQPTREKYKDNKDFDFIFITDERYTVIDKQGNVLNNNFPMHNFESEYKEILSTN